MILCVVGCVSVTVYACMWCLLNSFQIARAFKLFNYIIGMPFYALNILLCAMPSHAMPWKWTKIEKYQATTRVVKLELKCYAAIWRLCDSLYKWMRSRASFNEIYAQRVREALEAQQWQPARFIQMPNNNFCGRNLFSSRDRITR